MRLLPKCNPNILNKNLTIVYKDYEIGLQKIQMHSVNAAYGITEACDRFMDSKLTQVICKEIVTPFIDSLAFLRLVSSELSQFRRDYLRSNYQKR